MTICGSCAKEVKTAGPVQAPEPCRCLKCFLRAKPWSFKMKAVIMTKKVLDLIKKTRKSDLSPNATTLSCLGTCFVSCKAPWAGRKKQTMVEVYRKRIHKQLERRLSS
ncbi:hypothetical protein AT727_13775 [Desulfitobacterium hafniense]|uniref:Uncharacterized protein n=2 Tax=Desulfitobacterium hafniense TaxID=49338 RepID=Q24ZQ5_DESHY|nr:hypothetical protein AT727_13775 [Desulfitobacterium hafniense]BAE82487.1 hypothetical protein DSY0698 [Desulfitobacterium hafniense Y51]